MFVLFLSNCNFYSIFFSFFVEPRESEMAEKLKVLKAVLKKQWTGLNSNVYYFVFYCWVCYFCICFGVLASRFVLNFDFFFLMIFGVGKHAHRGDFLKLEV